MHVRIIGGGLAGAEAAWQAASRGVRVTLYEMRPRLPTAVHKTDRLAELVCSNSFRGDKLDNAVGLLKEEMRRLGSLVMRAAEASRVPAGAALAVDRERFAETITTALNDHPLITIVREEMTAIPESSDRAPVIVATGPLTADALSSAIAQLVGSDYLYFYDAISPIVLAETIDRSKVFRASRWNRSIRPVRLKPDATDTGGVRLPVGEPRGRQADQPACGVDDGEGDYLTCRLTREEYDRFYDALVTAESATVHDFDKERFFEGCLPIEVMAHRGRDTLRFGPMKPVGLTDPRTGREPYAAVQLRQENLMADAYNMVGFQNHLRYGEQARVLRMIPGLERAEFLQFGQIHRNTYINAPRVLAATMRMRSASNLFFAGQITGVEGYVESVAMGWLAGNNAVRFLRGEELLTAPPRSAIGALARYVAGVEKKDYQPVNITFALLEPLSAAQARSIKRKRDRHLLQVKLALEEWDNWLETVWKQPALVPAR